MFSYVLATANVESSRNVRSCLHLGHRCSRIPVELVVIRITSWPHQPPKPARPLNELVHLTSRNTVYPDLSVPNIIHVEGAAAGAFDFDNPSERVAGFGGDFEQDLFTYPAAALFEAYDTVHSVPHINAGSH